MVVSFGTPLITTLSLSLRQIYLKRSLKSSCRIIYRNYCSNNENVFAYNVIFKDRKVTKDGQDFIPIFSSLLTRNGNQSNSKPQIKLLDTQQWVSHQSRVVDLVNTQSEMTPEFLDGLCTSFKSLSEDELLKVIQCLNQCKKSNSLLHSTLVSKLDKECIRRLPQWNWNTSCQALQVWYNLDLIKLGKFYRRVMSHYSPLIQKMNSQQLVEFSFFLNLNRNFPTQLNTRNFETKLQLSWKNFSPNEMGVVSMAFFKCQKEITNAALLEQLVTAVKGNAKTIDDITLAAMLKLIRRSCTDASKTPTSVLSLFDALIDEIPRLNPKAIIQLVTVAGSINYFHHPTLEKVARRFSTEIGATRLKDLERFALSLSFSGYNSPAVDQFWKQVEMELVKTERQAEISHFPRSLISLLVYFVTLGRFPKELFRIAFDPENLNKTLDSSYTSVKREIPFLYHSIRIECPQYEGPAIPLATIKTLEDKQTKLLPGMKNGPLNYTDKFLLQLLDDTRSILGGNHLADLLYLETHFMIPDIFFCIDEEKNCPVEFSISSMNNDLEINSSKKWYSIVAGTRSMFTRNAHSEKGILQLKRRQLNILGYRNILIPWFSYVHLHQNDRLSYLRTKLNQCYRLS